MSTRQLLLPVFIPTFLVSVAQGLLIPTLPLYARSFGVSFELVSLAVAALSFGTTIFDVPSGVLLGRFGGKRVMLLGCAVLAVSTFAIGLTQLFLLLIALRLVMGSGMALWTLSRVTYITDSVPRHERGRAISTFGGVSRIGTFAGPAIGGLMAAHFGLRSPFFLYTALACAAFIIALVYISEPTHLDPAAHRHMKWSLVGQLVRTHYRALLPAGAVQITIQMIRAGRTLIFPLYGAYVIGLDVLSVGTIISLSSAIDMLLFYPAGLLMDRYGRKYAIVPSLFFMVLGLGLIPLSHSFLTLLLAGAVIGLGNGLGSGTMQTLGSDLAPKESLGEFLGIWRLIGDAGATGGPLVVGTIADAVGLSLGAVALCGVGIVGCLIMALVVPETLAAEHRRPVLRPGRT